MATNAKPEFDYRPSYLAATIAGALVLLLYVVTLSPSTAMWDTSEYIAAAYTLGLPHPPGNPLFVLLGRVMSLLPIAPSVAMRINLMAAFCSAVAAAMWFLVTERVLVTWFPERWRRILGASIATLIGATAFTVWHQSVVNEKVYTISLCGIAIISWLMVRWSDDPELPKADRIIVLVAYLLSLGYANHMAGMLAAPAVAVALVVHRPKMYWPMVAIGALSFGPILLGWSPFAVIAVFLALTITAVVAGLMPRWRHFLALVGVLALGMTPFATQPIRSAFYPPMNEGEPTACTNGLHWSCTFSKGTYTAFMYNFNRGQYGKPSLSDRQAPFVQGQIGMWWWYFRWQWMRDALHQHPGIRNLLAGIFLVLGLLGGWIHYKRDRRSFWYFASFMFTVTLVLIYYLNFKYGASQAPQLGNSVAREVRDRDYFFIWSFSPWGVWAALGLMFVWESLGTLVATEKQKIGRAIVEMPSRTGWLLGSPILLIAIIPLFANWQWASRAGDTATRDFAEDMLNSVEPYGVLVVVGDNDTFPLWFAQDVLGVRKDVVVANTSLLNTQWYVHQLIRRPVYPYDKATGPSIYRDKDWPKPTRGPLNMTSAQADAIPDYVAIPKTTTYSLGPIDATINPKNLAIQDGTGTGYLDRASVFVLRMIADSYDQRPIYLSRTSGPLPEQLGLGNNTLTQGLADKIFIPTKNMGPDTVQVAGAGYMDLRRTLTLWDSVFKAPKSLAGQHGWVDQPSIGIPLLYVATGIELAQVLDATGHQSEAPHVLDQTRNIVSALNLQNEFPSLQSAPPPLPPAPTGDSALALPLKKKK